MASVFEEQTLQCISCNGFKCKHQSLILLLANFLSMLGPTEVCESVFSAVRFLNYCSSHVFPVQIEFLN